jgi:hypothetical protein
MIIFITDSFKVKRERGDYILTNSIFNWQIKEENEEINLINKERLKIYGENLRGIVSPSNYRLIYDILYIDKKAKFIKPENFDKNINYDVDLKKIFSEFEKFLKRSYLSFLSFEVLKNLGLKRIEQAVILLLFASFQKINNTVYDNVSLKKSTELTIKKIEFIKTETIGSDYVSLDKFINIVMRETNFSFIEILSYLQKLNSELIISDLFSEEGFKFLKKEESELYDIYMKIKGQRKVEKYRIYSKEHSFFIYKTKNKDLFSDYHLLQTGEYLEGMFIKGITKKDILLDISNYAKKIMPIKDFFLSLQLLIKMGKISNELVLCEEIEPKIKLSKNLNWISLKKWEEIYNNLDYNFNYIIEPLEFKNEEFICPLCGEEYFNLTPSFLYCGNNNCNFKFSRTNIINFGFKKLNFDHMVKALSEKSILLKNKNGKNYPLFLDNNYNYYYLKYSK